MFGADWDTWGSAAPLCRPGEVILHQDLRISPFSHLRWREMMIPKYQWGSWKPWSGFSKLGAPGLPVLLEIRLGFSSGGQPRVSPFPLALGSHRGELALAGERRDGRRTGGTRANAQEHEAKGRDCSPLPAAMGRWISWCLSIAFCSDSRLIASFKLPSRGRLCL